jgi:hypothetical protein
MSFYGAQEQHDRSSIFVTTVATFSSRFHTIEAASRVASKLLLGFCGDQSYFY